MKLWSFREDLHHLVGPSDTHSKAFLQLTQLLSEPSFLSTVVSALTVGPHDIMLAYQDDSFLAPNAPPYVQMNLSNHGLGSCLASIMQAASDAWSNGHRASILLSPEAHHQALHNPEMWIPAPLDQSIQIIPVDLPADLTAATHIILQEDDNELQAMAASYSARSRRPLPPSFPGGRLPLPPQLTAGLDTSSLEAGTYNFAAGPYAPPTFSFPPGYPHTFLQGKKIPSSSSPEVWSPLLAAAVAPALGHHNPSWTPERASADMQQLIRGALSRLRQNARLDFFCQSLHERLTVGFLLGDKRVTPKRVFLDSGASVGLISIGYALSIGLKVFFSSVQLATSLSPSEGVLGVTGPITLQFGSSPNHVNLTTIFLVTKGMERLYDVLVSNEASHAFKGVTDHGSYTFTLKRPDGAHIVLPLQPAP